MKLIYSFVTCGSDSPFSFLELQGFKPFIYYGRKKIKDITTQEVEKISALIRNHPSSPSTEPKSNNYKNNMIKKKQYRH